MNWYEPILERDLLPDWLIRRAVRRLMADRLKSEARRDGFAFREELRGSPIAIHTTDANRQHYEVPARFFELVLGRNLKYSSCYWDEETASLDEAEQDMLELTVKRAGLEDGQAILELGCGWGSLTLFMAARFPNSPVTAVSNSASQRTFIVARAKERGLRNIKVVTCDMNDFHPDTTFDTIVSVEMFEHMRNYQELFRRISTWLKPGGLLFVHVFAHRKFAYPFDVQGPGDWMAEHFFTGGLMPSVELLPSFRDHLSLLDQWIVEGTHYARTSEEWLLLTDRHRAEILQLFSSVYGSENALRWLVRWRVFFIACAELFGYRGGNEWVVAHYLFSKNR